MHGMKKLYKADNSKKRESQMVSVFAATQIMKKTYVEIIIENFCVRLDLGRG